MPKAFEKLLDIYDRLTLPTGSRETDPGFGYPVMSREFRYPGFVVPQPDSDKLGEWRPISPSAMIEDRLLQGQEIDLETAQALRALMKEWSGYKRGTPSLYQWNPDMPERAGGSNTWRHEMVHAATGGYRGLPQAVVDDLAGSALWKEPDSRTGVSESMAHLSGQPAVNPTFLYKAIAAYERAGQPEVAEELKTLLLGKLDKERRLTPEFWQSTK